MAINETIYKGRAFRKCIDYVNKKWEKYSFWTAASDVEFDDGSNLEAKMSNMKGVSKDENSGEGYAADITLVKNIKVYLVNLISNLTKVVENINYRLGGLRFYEDSNGKWVVGADSVPKKLGENIEALNDIIGNDGVIEFGELSPRTNGNGGNITFPIEIDISAYSDYQMLDSDNFIVEILRAEFDVYHYGEDANTEYYVSGAGVAFSGINIEYNPSTGIIKLQPKYNTHNNGQYDRECNLHPSTMNYFKAKIYLKST